jgi:hypothetical protein
MVRMGSLGWTAGATAGPHPGHERPDHRGQHRSTPAHHLRRPPGTLPTRRRSPRSPEISDTEEDGGSTPPAPTTPALSRAFVSCSSLYWVGSVGEASPAVGRALTCLTRVFSCGRRPRARLVLRAPIPACRAVVETTEFERAGRKRSPPSTTTRPHCGRSVPHRP